ncbi:MAG: hypothetical protein ACKOC5_03875, partial [Chloroflexota bacterium]
LAQAAARVDDNRSTQTGWLRSSLSDRPHEYDPARAQEIYSDALEAWRRNPLAWRAISITTDYVVGDRLAISSPYPALERFIQAFWNHPKNRMPQRLETMCDELSRAGDLFVLLFRNPQDGMSYIRFVTKDRIQRIETAANDWEVEQRYLELPDGPAGEPRAWLSPQHPAASEAEAVMLHYAINRPLGAVTGESDLTTMLPWMQRYNRMVEDRVRLHAAMRSFLWMVTVPTPRVREKLEQYRLPPEPGSIIVKDESEQWQANAPNLRGLDAARDLQAVRGLVDAGSGYPPHWRGDAGDISLATAQAMQGPTERHLRRRQQYFLWMLQDILYHAYRRSVEIGRGRPLAATDYRKLFHVGAQDISRWDNESLARSARDVAQALSAMHVQLGGGGAEFLRKSLAATFKFMGEPLDEAELTRMVAQAAQAAPGGLGQSAGG